MRLHRSQIKAPSAAARGAQRLVPTVLAALLAANLLCTSVAVGAQYEVDFLNSQFDNARLRMMGPGAPTLITSSAEGLVMSLSQGTRTNELGFAPRFKLRGDFEITLQYELKQITQPKKGYGVGTSMYILTESEEEHGATIGRLYRVKEGQVHSTHLVRTPGGIGDRKNQVWFFESDTQCGQLRLTRSGDRLTFAAAEGDGGEFQTLQEANFTGADVRLVRVALTRNGAGADVPAAVVLKRFTIQAQRFLKDDGSSRWGLWLAIALLTGILGIAIGAVVRWRRRVA